MAISDFVILTPILDIPLLKAVDQQNPTIIWSQFSK
jgi:hypothetical protein